MQFSVGYPTAGSEPLMTAVSENREHIAEVYFSFDDFPNGRNAAVLPGCESKWAFEERQRADLKQLSAWKIGLNLLLNGNCYGKYAQSRSFFLKIGEAVEYLAEQYSLRCVTTTSPLIAKFIKQNFEEITVRASVNMEIGTAEGMDYIAEFFDSFYLRREYNRNLQKLQEARTWCDENHKQLFGLANSGCLNFCSVHTFHDNLVAHENEIAQMDNAYAFTGQCREYLKKDEKRTHWLRLTNFIRPEDVSLYAGMFDGLKLATRVNADAARIVRAYCSGSYNGALTGLLEPDHAGVFYPAVIDNKSIAPAFAKKVMCCQKDCRSCGYCDDVQQHATIILDRRES